MGILQTKSLVTILTIKMTVQFLGGTDVVIMTVTILCGAAAIFYLVHQMVLGKESQTSENAGTVHAFQFIFQISETESIRMFNN